jgi:sugar-specific transcriptional regulator TrmB
MSSSHVVLEGPALDFLRKIGLSKYESMLYLSLLRFGCGCYRELTKWSRVPYGRVYYVLERLVVKGFVEKDGQRPAIYRAIEPVKALQLYLMDQYQNVINELQQAYATRSNAVHNSHDEFVITSTF